MKEKLPYSNSKTQPHLAKTRIEKILHKFEVSQINFGEDYEAMEIRVSFIFRKTPVTIPINYRELGKLFEIQSLNYETNSDFNPEEKFLKIAKNASYAAIEDYLKAMLTMHKLGIMTIEEIFLPNLTMPTGIRLIDHIKEKLPDMINSGKLLTQ